MSEGGGGGADPTSDESGPVFFASSFAFIAIDEDDLVLVLNESTRQSGCRIRVALTAGRVAVAQRMLSEPLMATGEAVMIGMLRPFIIFILHEDGWMTSA